MRPLLISGPKFQPLMVCCALSTNWACAYQGARRLLPASSVQQPSIKNTKTSWAEWKQKAPSTTSWLWRCPIAIAYKEYRNRASTQRYFPSTASSSSAAHRGGAFVLAERIFFVSTSHSFLNYLSLFLLLLLPRWRVRRESLGNPSAAICACERAEKGSSEIWVMGKNVERQRNEWLQKVCAWTDSDPGL